MNDITFEQLTYASACCHADLPYLVLINEWAIKRDHVALYLHDIPNLLKAYKVRVITAHPTNPDAAFVDPYPSTRLATACEGIAHSVYSLADIAASVANKASNGIIPSSFNALCKKLASGKIDGALTAQLSDLGWYARVRELRTEWSHHSSIFIGEDADGEPIVCANCYRRRTDQHLLEGRIQIKPNELLDWSNRATLAIDRFGSAVFHQFILPAMPLDQVIYVPRRDKFGFPEMTNGRMHGDRILVREYLRRGGIQIL